MKKYIIMALSLLFVSFVMAQSNYTAPQTEKANKLTQQMKVSLNLAQAQTTQIQVVNLEVVKRIDAAISNNNDNELLKAAIKAINTYRDKELKKVLTTQQYDLLKSNVNGRSCGLQE